MGYLKDILNQISNGQNIIFVGTGMFLIDTQDRIFMACRTDNNQWCVPGGSLELHESLEHCAVRETFEETGIQVKEDDIHLNAVKAILEPINKNGSPIYVVSVSYWSKVYDDIDFNLESREFTKYGWFTQHELEQLHIAPYTREGLKEYFKNKGEN